MEDCVLKTIDNDLKDGLSSFLYLEMFDTLRKVLETLSFASCF